MVLICVHLFVLIPDDFRYKGTVSQVAQNTKVLDMGN